MAMDMQGGEIKDVALDPPPPFGEAFTSLGKTCTFLNH
jgi:hypothetical protein